jgi:uncharacterized protein YjbI with pentapeptide repeats
MSENFYKKNVKGRSFKGKDLSEVDFSDSDIRGANFNNAILVGANFSNTKAGLTLSWSIGLGIIIFLLAALTGLVLGWGGAFPDLILRILAKQGTPIAATLIGASLIVLTTFSTILLQRGIGTELGLFAVIVAVITGMTVFFGRSDNEIIAASLLLAIIIAIIIASILIGSVVLALSWMLAQTKLIIPVGAILILTAILGAIESIVGIGKEPPLISLIMAGLLSVGLLTLSCYIGLQAIAENQKYRLIRSISIFVCSALGTNFAGANLTNVDFTQVTLPHTNFKKAKLKRTSWFQSTKIELSRVEGTYLEDASLRQLVVTKDGHGNIYDYKNLQGLNLQAANLTDASFIGADLNESNLQDADFTRAKLVKTRLYGADLTHSCLSGTCIQDWAIPTDTKLEQVVCTHIYMRLPTQEDPDPWRKPDNRNETFKEGDFTDFIAPIIKTLDLYRQQNVDPRQIASTFKSLDFYHYGGIDPAAAAVALKQLSEENPEAGLEVITLEGRGSEKIRLQAVVTGEANSSQLNVEYFEKYREISSLPYSDIQALLAGAAEKDERIRSLEKLLGDALQQPKFYIETYQNQGEFIMAQENKGNANISGVQGNISGIAAAGENQTFTGVAIGAISGNVTNTISQLPDTTNPNEPSLKELLTQLQALIESESELNEEDKVEALEQVKVLAEAGQKPEDSTLQKLAKTAVKILKGTIASLPDVTQLVESGAKLLPYITKILGLP